MSFPQGGNPFADAPPVQNPYASPAMAVMPAPGPMFQPDQPTFYRWGDQLVMPKWAQLPQICVKSNQPATRWLKRKLQWHPTWLIVLVLISPLIYIIVALIMTQRATIQIPITDEWHQRRKTRLGITWGIALLGMALFALAIVLGSQGPEMGDWFLLMIPAIFIMLGAAIYGNFACRLVYPAKINETHIYLNGVHPEFLNHLPVWPYPA